MDWIKPSRAEVIHAIGIYLPLAYADAAPPKTVRARIEAITAVPECDFYTHAAFEADKTEQPPARYAVRLGNRSYPHMKVIIERTPDGGGHLYRADTHDQHVRPAPGSRDAKAFSRLMVENQQIAERIELAWTVAGLPTFKAYLRQDLARRMAALRGDKPQP